MSAKKYVVLGGGGSFGIQTAFYLLDHAEPASVTGIGRNFLRPEPFSLNIQERQNYTYKTFHTTYEYDLLLDYLDDLKPEIIINFAAQGEGAASWSNSWRYFETNSMGLVRLAESLAERDWLEHFIHIGTSEMYGSVDHPVTEDEPIKPTSPYATSKVAFDLFLLSASRFKNFPMTILRPSNCYCPGQLLHRVIPKAIISGLTGKKLPLHGGGRAEKSYLHARDLARAILILCEKGPTGDVFNVGPQNATSIRKVVELCADALNMPCEELFYEVEERLGQDSRYWLDSTKAARELGWQAEIGWEEGLGDMVGWAKKYLPILRETSTEYVFRG